GMIVLQVFRSVEERRVLLPDLMIHALSVSEISGNLFDKPASNARFRRRITVAAGRHSVTKQGRQMMLKRILGATLMAASLGTASIAA
ncbi:hypothetical protein ACC710_37055, partial [Rhizobium ruizarguesonis]